MLDQFRRTIQTSIDVKAALLADEQLLRTLAQVVETSVASLKAGGQLLFCGNGGSAADAQHIAAELSGRFYKDRPALRAEALHVNSSYLTAVANDYGFAEAYRRLVEGITQPGDILFALSTSGNSANIVAAARQARSQEVRVVGLTGQTGGQLADHCDFLLNVPSIETPRIQESHILLGHLLCEHVEYQLFPDHD